VAAVVLSLLSVGCKGDKGDTGPQGDPGRQGDVGPAGPAGIGFLLRGQSAAATATGAATRQVVVGTADLANGVTADGIFAAVVDRATQQVETANTKNWPVGTLLEAANLANMLNAHGPDKVVLLASKGDVSPFLEAAVGNVTLYDALLRCGASEEVLTLDPASGFALVGSCGTGAGKGSMDVARGYDATTDPDGRAARVGAVLQGGEIIGGGSRPDSFFSLRGTYPALINRETSRTGLLAGSWPNYSDHKTFVGELIFTRAGRLETAHEGNNATVDAPPRVYVNFYVWSPVAQTINIAWGGLDECRAFLGSGEDPTYVQQALDTDDMAITTTSFNLAAGSNNIVFYSRWINEGASLNVQTEFFRSNGLRVDWRRLMKDLRK
jgi:hypothetical protein